MKSATCTLKFSALILLIGLAGCSTTSRQAEEQALMAQQQAQEEAEKQAIAAAQLARREQAQAEQAAQQAEARRVAEAREREAAELRAREEAERAAVAEREQAERRREQQARAVAERAQVVARQQARIAELRAQIAANNTEANDLDGANAALKEAIAAAEELTVVLTEEQAKYTSADPATGMPQQELSKESIEQLGAEIERLRRQADALTANP